MVKEKFLAVEEFGSGKSILKTLKELENNFPNYIVPFRGNTRKLEYLRTLGYVEKLPRSALAGKKVLGKIDTYKISNYGLSILNEITLKNTNKWIKALTIVLVILATAQLLVSI
jgi:hypothetical protein